mmetsp:Transcript_124220/g.362600  ORF Transcript_124220/g.362600 Transcript_124220/m.362600 type:complete len:91 (+) Transcript_124220:33-305(+)
MRSAGIQRHQFLDCPIPANPATNSVRLAAASCIMLELQRTSLGSHALHGPTPRRRRHSQAPTQLPDGLSVEGLEAGRTQLLVQVTSECTC